MQVRFIDGPLLVVALQPSGLHRQFRQTQRWRQGFPERFPSDRRFQQVVRNSAAGWAVTAAVEFGAHGAFFFGVQ